MSKEITLGLNFAIQNPATGGGLADSINDSISVNQGTQGKQSGITTIAIPSGTTLQGTVAQPSAVAATTTTLPANTYANSAAGVGATLTGNSNGAFAAVDGVTLVVGQLVMVNNEASALKNGLYKLTTLGDGGNPYVLTRSTTMDSTGKYVGSVVYVSGGATNGGKNWNCTNASAPTVGTTAIAFLASTAGTSISFGSVSSPGYLYLKNLDATNYVNYGPVCGGAMQNIGKLKAGEWAMLRLDLAVTIAAVANTAPVNLWYDLYSD